LILTKPVEANYAPVLPYSVLLVGGSSLPPAEGPVFVLPLPQIKYPAIMMIATAIT
jgi:hypothetical protein